MMLYVHTTNPSKSQKSKPRAGNGVDQSVRFKLKMLNEYQLTFVAAGPWIPSRFAPAWNLDELEHALDVATGVTWNVRIWKTKSITN